MRITAFARRNEMFCLKQAQLLVDLIQHGGSKRGWAGAQLSAISGSPTPPTKPCEVTALAAGSGVGIYHPSLICTPVFPFLPSF